MIYSGLLSYFYYKNKQKKNIVIIFRVISSQLINQFHFSAAPALSTWCFLTIYNKIFGLFWN